MQIAEISPQQIDWQGHRGARGLMPENTIPAFLKALEFPVSTLELDVVISKDEQIVVSHEPWMSYKICSHPDGRPVLKNKEKHLNIFQMSYDEIRRFDCGKRGNPDYPHQQVLAAHKPLLREVVEAVEQFCKANNRDLIRYNIEIKSRANWDDVFAPTPQRFVEIFLGEINRLGIRDRVIVQSFDMRSLRAVHEMDETMMTSLLVYNWKGLNKNLKRLGYMPDIYSPYFRYVNKRLVKKVHTRGMRIIPWTVNSPKNIRKMIDLGVDGIITDYPDRIADSM